MYIRLKHVFWNLRFEDFKDKHKQLLDLKKMNKITFFFLIYSQKTHNYVGLINSIINWSIRFRFHCRSGN